MGLISRDFSVGFNDIRRKNEETVNGNKVRDREDVPYSSIRGIIAPKGYKSNDEILLFQFNPEQITDVKEAEWSTKSYTGFNANNYYWVKGGERSLTFKLYFDATASYNTKLFGVNTAYGNQGADSLDSVFPRGVMDMVEKLTKFQYPIQEDSSRPRFSTGLAVPNTRFLPPPIATFIFGDLYLECVVASVSADYTLFNKKLQPIRAECSVTLKVIETDVVVIDENLRKQTLSSL